MDLLARLITDVWSQNNLASAYLTANVDALRKAL